MKDYVRAEERLDFSRRKFDWWGCFFHACSMAVMFVPMP